MVHHTVALLSLPPTVADYPRRPLPIVIHFVVVVDGTLRLCHSDASDYRRRPRL